MQKILRISLLSLNNSLYLPINYNERTDTLTNYSVNKIKRADKKIITYCYIDFYEIEDTTIYFFLTIRLRFTNISISEYSDIVDSNGKNTIV